MLRGMLSLRHILSTIKIVTNGGTWPVQNWGQNGKFGDVNLCAVTEVIPTFSYVFNNHNHDQGGRSWQPFGEGKNGHTSFRQARFCYFCDKCVVFERICKFTNLNQYNMKYVATSATLTLFNICLTPVRVLRLLDTCIELCIILLILLGWLVSILSPMELSSPRAKRER